MQRSRELDALFHILMKALWACIVRHISKFGRPLRKKLPSMLNWALKFSARRDGSQTQRADMILQVLRVLEMKTVDVPATGWAFCRQSLFLCETHKPAIDLCSQNPADLNTVPEVEQEENHET